MGKIETQNFIVTVDVLVGYAAKLLGLAAAWAGRGDGLCGARLKCWLWCDSWCCCGRMTCLFALLSL